MFVIIEWNGVSASGVMGLVMTDDCSGNVRSWNSEASADKWAKKNCAFNYKIVKLY
jgi:hypothetical protein